jgi:transglutaminase superfamily protein
VQATILLAVARIGLRTLPFATLRNIFSKLSTIGTRGAGAVFDNRFDNRVGKQVVWAVDTVGRHLPLIGTCLTQALAAHVLLSRSGLQSDLRIGVTRDPNGKFVAHAWLEKQGAILIGGDCSKDYTPMPALNGIKP